MWDTIVLGSGIAGLTAAAALAHRGQRVLVLLDSNHTHDHVLAELEAYATLVGAGGYCVVYDTLIEDMPDDLIQERPWGSGNNPKTAVRDFLSRNRGFVVNEDIEAKLLITVAPGGYLKRVDDGG